MEFRRNEQQMQLAGYDNEDIILMTSYLNDALNLFGQGPPDCKEFIKMALNIITSNKKLGE